MTGAQIHREQKALQLLIDKYAIECANREKKGKDWPQIPKKLRSFFEIDSVVARDRVKNSPFYINRMKNPKWGKRK